MKGKYRLQAEYVETREARVVQVLAEANAGNPKQKEDFPLLLLVQQERQAPESLLWKGDEVLVSPLPSSIFELLQPLVPPDLLECSPDEFG